MKLINKKTGEIAEIKLKLNESLSDGIRRTIEEAGWEETREPLIKDERIRKAVRAWAKALKADVIRFERFSQGFSFGDGNVYSYIDFDGCVFELGDGKEYTITELCGEEE